MSLFKWFSTYSFLRNEAKCGIKGNTAIEDRDYGSRLAYQAYHTYQIQKIEYHNDDYSIQRRICLS